ncbi:calcium-binding protein, partial [Phocoenobacter atlanticus]|uniref:calcium-binding protein n=1 Tax=Phocoenobacter atlanticus TaxID=3416742 RepID=UPI0027696095
DWLSGYQGNDIIYGGNGNDKLYGEDGNDRLEGYHGNDMIYGGNGSDKLFGELGNDLIYGGNGNDTLYGGAGNDILVGGAGNDVFVFDTVIGKDIDTIRDFSEGDKIQLSDVIFEDVDSVTSSNFVVGKSAQDTDDRLIYNNTTGELLYDADGSGSASAIHFANIYLDDNGLLNCNSFIV